MSKGSGCYFYIFELIKTAQEFCGPIYNPLIVFLNMYFTEMVYQRLMGKAYICGNGKHLQNLYTNKKKILN